MSADHLLVAAGVLGLLALLLSLGVALACVPALYRASVGAPERIWLKDEGGEDGL